MGKFSRETSRMTRDDLLPSDCKNTRDSSWAATANDFQSSDDVYLKIESAHPVDSGEWDFEVNPSDPQGSPVFAKPIVWVVAGDSIINQGQVSFASNGFILAFDF